MPTLCWAGMALEGCTQVRWALQVRQMLRGLTAGCICQLGTKSIPEGTWEASLCLTRSFSLSWPLRPTALPVQRELAPGGPCTTLALSRPLSPPAHWGQFSHSREGSQAEPGHLKRMQRAFRSHPSIWWGMEGTGFVVRERSSPASSAHQLYDPR